LTIELSNIAIISKIVTNISRKKVKRIYKIMRIVLKIFVRAPMILKAKSMNKKYNKQTTVNNGIPSF